MSQVEPAVLGDERITRALVEIDRRIDDPPHVAELARLCGLGMSRFTRLFRERTGDTPARYVRRRRLMRARENVANSRDSIKAIASAHGFRDAAHFSRAYFAMHGAWPSQHRRLCQAGTHTAMRVQESTSDSVIETTLKTH